jgi:cation transport ATPase
VQIDWAQFTPWGSLAGGILIGLASSLLRCYSAASPVFAGAAMALSSVSVVTNALRLNRIKL